MVVEGYYFVGCSIGRRLLHRIGKEEYELLKKFNLDFNKFSNVVDCYKNLGTIYQFTLDTIYSIQDYQKRRLPNGNRLLIMSKFFRMFTHIFCQPFHTIGYFKCFQYH